MSIINNITEADSKDGGSGAISIFFKNKIFSFFIFLENLNFNFFKYSEKKRKKESK